MPSAARQISQPPTECGSRIPVMDRGAGQLPARCGRVPRCTGAGLRAQGINIPRLGYHGEKRAGIRDPKFRRLDPAVQEELAGTTWETMRRVYDYVDMPTLQGAIALLEAADEPAPPPPAGAVRAGGHAFSQPRIHSPAPGRAGRVVQLKQRTSGTPPDPCESPTAPARPRGRWRCWSGGRARTRVRPRGARGAPTAPRTPSVRAQTSTSPARRR
jgi:hypothetical protein